MKTLSFGLTDQAPVLVYDETKPYLAGRAFEKTISGTTVLGPPLTGFSNTFLDTASGVLATSTTPNGRQFQLLTITGGLATIALYNIDVTGQTAPAYVGRILARVPNAAATAHSVRGFEVYDGPNNATVTNWQIYIGTAGSVLINGGLFTVNKVDYADFSPLSPPTFEMGISSDAKAVYLNQDPAFTGATNNLTAMQGMALQPSTRLLVFHNNLLATTQFIKFDMTVAPAVTLKTTTSPTASGSPTFTLTAHGYANNDPVVITSNAPTGFTLTGSGVQTVYFIRNATANTFELSATSGGASINATSITASTVLTRAFGTTNSNWMSIRTGTVTGFAGVILLTNCESIVVPNSTLDPAIPAAVDGQDCLFMPTNSNVYLIKLSEITNGATTFPTMVTVNVLGNGTDVVTIAPTFAAYSEVIGRIILISNTSQFYIKRWTSSAIDLSFGGLNTLWLENSSNKPYTFAGAAIVNLEVKDGWLYATLSTVGQRGVLYMDLRSHCDFGYSYVTSPIIDTSDVAFGKTIQTIEELFDLTSTMQFEYKTAATSSDVIFDDPDTGWTTFEQASDLSAISFNKFTQARICFDIAVGNVNTPAQINSLFLSYIGKGEISDYWTGSVDNTSLSGASPMYVAFRLNKVYDTSVPTMYLRGYDDTGALVYNFNTVTDVAMFSYSTNNGTSWTALGTVPNTALTTEIRALISSPTGNRVTWSLMES